MREPRGAASPESVRVRVRGRVRVRVKARVELREEACRPLADVGVARAQRHLPERVGAGERQLEHHEVARVLLHEALLLPVDPPG